MCKAINLSLKFIVMFNLAILSFLVTGWLLYFSFAVPYKSHKRHYRNRAKKGVYIPSPPSPNCGSLVNASFCEEDSNYPPQSVLDRIAKSLGEHEKTAMMANSVDFDFYNSYRGNHDYGGDYVEKQYDSEMKVCPSKKQRVVPRFGSTAKDGSKR